MFALGGRDPADDGAESGYFAMRLALAESLKSAAGRTLGQMLPGFLGTIASRFGGPVALKVSAQAAPLIGAAAGAAVNLAFLEHYRASPRRISPSGASNAATARRWSAPPTRRCGRACTGPPSAGTQRTA